MAYRLALVTGATSGIGKAACELLASKGLDLVITGRNQEQLELLQKTLSKDVSIETLQADLSHPQGRVDVISVLHQQSPDIVINNAGFGFYGEALTYSTEEQVDILEVNGRAVLELSLEAARALVSKGKKGIILNVSSAAGFQVFPMMAVYAASKSFVNYFSQAFDFEVRRHGIRVLTLCPGMVATNFQKRAGSVDTQATTGAMSPSFVAEQIWKQIERLDPLSIIDWKYRLLTFVSYFVPTSWIAAAAGGIIAKRMNPRTFINIKQ
jgi:uncharacterized protein